MEQWLASISSTELMALAVGSLLIGISKGGIKGLTSITVLLMADAFGAKLSTGIVLILLCMGDIMAISYYRRNVVWSYVWKLLPAAIVGILVGVWIGDQLDGEAFKRILAWTVILGILLIIWQEYQQLSAALMGHPVVTNIAGFIGGFTTMVGNAAGPVMSIYLLATRLKKNEFIGTAAWFFLFINFFKIPFHIWVWETISWPTIKLNLLALPVIAIGFFIGVKLVKYIPEKAFRYFIIVVTLIGAVKLLF